MTDHPPPTDVPNDPLDQLLDELPLPTRMLAVARKLNLCTVRDLLAVHPRDLALKPNLGRTSLAATRAVLESLCDSTWEQAAEEQRARPRGAPPSRAPFARSWKSLARVLPASLQDVSLAIVPGFPARMVTFTEAHEVTTLGALVPVPVDVLVSSRNLGRKTIQDTIEAVTAFVRLSKDGRPFSVTLEAHGDLLALWRERTAHLKEPERTVLHLRAGVEAPALTLAQVGSRLGHTTEWSRQLEQRALAGLGRDRTWLDAIEARLRARIPDSSRRVDALVAEDPWFTALRDAPVVSEFLFDRLLDQRFRYAEIDGERLVVTFDPAQIAGAWRAVAHALKVQTWPTTRATLEALLDRFASGFGAAVRERFLHRIEGAWFLDPKDANRVVGYGRGGARAQEVRELLRAADGPMSSTVLSAAVRERDWPDDVVFVAYGKVTLRERLEHFDPWTDRLAPHCEAWMRTHGPERQWTCAELAAALTRQNVEVPTWFSPCTLGAMLTRSGRVRNLGRFVVALLGVTDTRTLVRDVLTEVLEHAGAPLPSATLFERVHARRGATSQSLADELSEPCFVEVSPGVWGLLERDLPGGSQAAHEAAERTIAMLQARGCGLSLVECMYCLRVQNALCYTWTDTMVRSAWRHSPELCVGAGPGRVVSLAAWGESRLPPPREIALRCLAEGGGRIAVGTVLARIALLHGEFVSARALVRSLGGDGVRQEGAELVAHGAPPSAGLLPDLPPDAGVVFTECDD